MYEKDKEKLNMKDIIGVDLSHILNNTKKPLKTIILDEYNNSSSYNDFFKKLHTKFGKIMLCEYLQPWIRDFMRALNFEQYFYMDWEISKEEI